ncbi:MAG TPA: hypothetical protein VEL28_14275 [Candidatus Binatia bacterium]|nr:hypothetical protein [Candidatus Binatia bacterium]
MPSRTDARPGPQRPSRDCAPNRGRVALAIVATALALVTVATGSDAQQPQRRYDDRDHETQRRYDDRGYETRRYDQRDYDVQRRNEPQAQRRYEDRDPRYSQPSRDPRYGQPGDHDRTPSYPGSPARPQAEPAPRRAPMYPANRAPTARRDDRHPLLAQPAPSPRGKHAQGPKGADPRLPGSTRPDSGARSDRREYWEEPGRESYAAPEPYGAHSGCGNPVGIEVFVTPAQPVPGSPLRVIAVSERAIDGELYIISPSGDRIAESAQRSGGPPYWWYAEVMPRELGRYRGVLRTGGSTACADADVSHNPAPLPERPTSAVWPVERRWDRNMENLFSAWVEKLFDDPLDASPSWDSLHEITRQASRNFLHDHLGYGEDSDGGLKLEPDCADLPYFLRGYFAWKMRLPFGWSKCHRVAAGQAPTCVEWHSNLESGSGSGGELARVQRFLARDVGWGVHSGTDRTLGDDDKTDVYPTRLSAQTLRPGTVFADPYGHILILVRRLPQTPTSSGQFLAVDAQPDGTVARKQFWRGTFLFTIDPKLGGAGFKNFRPILPMGDSLRLLTNQEILDHPDYGDFSMEQYEHGTDGFYDRVDEVLSPEPRDAEQVVREIVDSLEQQVRTRVDSVQNGEDYMAKNPGVVPLPKGAAIFQTVGPWEDYATPSRDLRLLIAIDVVRSFPERVARSPRRYHLPAGGGDVRARLQAILDEETRRRTFEYIRSNGTPQTLRLSDVLERAVDLEMAYNPNDCVEIRWGAPEGSPERATCKRTAPNEQRRRMNHQYRDWFRDRRRPST